MGRCGGSMALYLMAIVLLIGFFASSAKCRLEPLDDGNKAASISSNGNATAALNSTAAPAAPVNGSSGSGDEKLEWCILRNCVYEGRGNAPCFCCAATKDNECYETREKCRGNCVS